jgi:galactonate dehydratase
VYRLLGGRCHDRLPAYANGWYGGARTPEEFAERAKDVVARGYLGMKFDPFGTAWKTITRDEADLAVETVASVRNAVGPSVALMIEFHGRLAQQAAIPLIRRLERYDPAWCEEPVAPECLEHLAEVKRAVASPLAAGERLYTQADFFRLMTLRAVDVVQMDIAHCGGILAAKKIAAMAAAQDVQVSPHCSIGPVALAACLHCDLSTPNFLIQEAFGEFDAPWRNELVGEFTVNENPGLGFELDLDAIARHPYVEHAFPSLWDEAWIKKLTQSES